MEQGKEVGLRARLEVPGARYEASLATGELFARADILESLADGRHGLTEVKATRSVKEEHLTDVAFQSLRRGPGGDRPRARGPDAPQSRLPAPRPVEPVQPGGADRRGGGAAGRHSGRPVAAIRQGPRWSACLRCRSAPSASAPEACPFLDRCWPRPRHHVSTLYYLKKSKALELERAGHASVTTLPPTLKLSAIQQRQQLAVASGELIVEPGLAAALDAWPRPLVFLDFETVTFAIPRFPGTGPWDQIPVQYSAHVERGGEFAHHPFLAEGAGDPRPALAAALVEACAGAGSVVAYYSSFEDGCLAQLAEAVPRTRRGAGGDPWQAGGPAAGRSESCLPPGVQRQLFAQVGPAGVAARSLLRRPRHPRGGNRRRPSSAACSTAGLFRRESLQGSGRICWPIVSAIPGRWWR